MLDEPVFRTKKSQFPSFNLLIDFGTCLKEIRQCLLSSLGPETTMEINEKKLPRPEMEEDVVFTRSSRDRGTKVRSTPTHFIIENEHVSHFFRKPCEIQAYCG